MSNVVPHPAYAVDMAVADLASQIAVLHALAEAAEDGEWARLRPAVTDMLCMMGEQARRANLPLARLEARSAS